MSLRTYIYFTMLLLTSVIPAGCSMVHDDLDPCPSGVDLEFVYDYNIQRADMFSDHVGGITVYVFDENGKFLMQQEEANSAVASPLASHAYRMHLDIAPGKYQFIAIAHQKSHEECLAAPGAKYRRTQMISGTHSRPDLNVILDRDGGRVAHQGVPLDTLWHGMGTELLEVKDMQAVTQKISLVRDTKELTISLHQLDAPADIDISDYEITITADNGHIAHDNSLIPDEVLTYTPYAVWNTEFTSEGSRSTSDEVVVLERTAHAALSFNRVIHYPLMSDNDKNAMLSIRHIPSGRMVAQINLPDYLAQGRGAFEYYNYTPQEFLDREHDYKLDFFLRGDTWEYVNLSISIAAWAKHIQNVTFN